MPEISNFYGITIYMYVSEHNPPHFHVAYQGFKAIITILSRREAPRKIEPLRNCFELI